MHELALAKSWNGAWPKVQLSTCRLQLLLLNPHTIGHTFIPGLEMRKLSLYRIRSLNQNDLVSERRGKILTSDLEDSKTQSVTVLDRPPVFHVFIP